MSGTSSRKNDHIFYSLTEACQFTRKTSWLEHVELVHTPMPSLDYRDVDTSTAFLEHRLRAPLLIAGMTGGTQLAAKLNSIFASAAEKLGIAVGVGSQRAALENPELKSTFRVVRERAPSVPVIANIGASQLVEYEPRALAEAVVGMVDADALALHLNPLQELLQPEGQPRYGGLAERIVELVEESPVPVILKETGCGFSREAALAAVEAGVYGVDVGGAGGTSFAKVEGLRAEEMGEGALARLAWEFGEWGIPTAASILEVRSVSRSLKVIATGGVRGGVDVARALRLGADVCGLARPVLTAAFKGGLEAVEDYLSTVIRGLRMAMYLTGSRTIDELRGVPVVLRGDLLAWARARNLVKEENI